MSKHILIIEDNINMLDNIAEILELANYKVSKSANGKEGLSFAKSNTVDLILCDIMMPELDGYGVLKIINSHPELKKVPFIFMSAKSEKEDFREAMRLGADDYLFKPFQDVQLIEAIETRLKKHNHKQADNFEDLHVNNINSLFNIQKAEKELEELFQDVPLENFSKKDVLFRKDAIPRYLYLLKSGMLKTVMTNENGKELISGLYAPNDFIGLIEMFGSKHYMDEARFVANGSCKKILREDFLKAIFEKQDLAFYFYTRLNFSVSIRKDRLLHLAYDSVRKRTADSLLWLNDIYNKSNEYPFKIVFTREDLAAMVGTAKESLIRTLSTFKDEQIIDLNIGEIVIYSKEKLEDLIV